MFDEDKPRVGEHSFPPDLLDEVDHSFPIYRPPEASSWSLSGPRLLFPPSPSRDDRITDPSSWADQTSEESVDAAPPSGPTMHPERTYLFHSVPAEAVSAKTEVQQHKPMPIPATKPGYVTRVRQRLRHFRR